MIIKEKGDKSESICHLFAIKMYIYNKREFIMFIHDILFCIHDFLLALNHSDT